MAKKVSILQPREPFLDQHGGVSEGWYRFLNSLENSASAGGTTGATGPAGPTGPAGGGASGPTGPTGPTGASSPSDLAMMESIAYWGM
jgi:hypothetical protein